GVGGLVATPGRLLVLQGQGLLDVSSIEILVLDEADRMLDMGFLPSIQRIVQVLPRERQTLMFSATLSRDIEALIHKFQQHPKIVQIGRRSNPAETVTQLVYEVPRHLKMPLFVHLLTDPKMHMVLAFARTKHSADRIARQLEKSGIPTATLHSNRSQNQRLRALKDFKAGAVRVLVATDIASRGIDVDGISHVVNFDFPMHAEDYVHRIGRTGRAQAVGDAISLVTPDDRAHVRSLERFIGRGLVRKKPEGFDTEAKATEEAGADRTETRQRQPRPAPSEQRRRGPMPQSQSQAPRGPASMGSQKPWERGARPDAPRPVSTHGDQSGRPAGSRPPFRGPRPDDRRPAPAGGQWQDRGPRPASTGYGGGRPGQAPRGDRPQSHDSRPPSRPADDRFGHGGGAPVRRDEPGSGPRAPFRGPRTEGPRSSGFRSETPRGSGPRPSGGPRTEGSRPAGPRPGGFTPRPKFRS
ncbi:MAG: DEAD/DEAH box helicase, partial [Verrucomicrobia bacterium]